MAAVKIIPEKIHLQDIKTINAKLERSPDINIVAGAEGFDLRFAHNLSWDDTNNRVALTLLIEADARSTNNGLMGKGFFELLFLFHIENLQDYLTSDKDLVKMNILLAATLVGLSFSTSRGMLLTFTRNTLFEGLILPIVNPVKIIKEPSI
ncbi:hypothetical protein LY01_02685 [Nonlabens xylanidelens]|uniref:Preprotein translocase subunit SecB n=1 Tax=Nonlabens xylanidelens TaxID=191564 RepID=A0A2S6IFJ4_9FLAO|nr:hypothetical protein [Nonlabens xylanidelens]PPK92981.1 hypothetical protein LY01_02685 [Nonlabens xylanidelens]PQJ18808.1 hypothetical protein BST94_07270 [Nonlabens xylanidelens]